MQNFADRLTAAMEQKQSQLCVGLDPRVSSMPEELLERYRARNPEGGCGCGRHEVADCFEEFCATIIDEVAPHAAAVKLQLACFEQYGPPGMKAFKHSCDRAANAGLIVIADAKRGDIDVSAAAYSAAYIGAAEGLRGPVRPFKIDAVTVNPLFGSDGIKPFLDDCSKGKGIFVLVKTSNASSSELQELELASGELFYEQVARLTAGWGEDLIGSSGYSSVGAVAGATDPQSLARVRELIPRAILLVPGVGAQGAGAREAAAAFDKNGLGALITASRSIIYAGRDADYGTAAAGAAQQMKEALWSASH